MDLNSFHDLLSPAGAELLNIVQALGPREEDYLLYFQRLSRKYPTALVQAALETVLLRHKAKQKYPFAETMFFTRQALEQATPWAIAVYRARRYANFARVLDLGCSIGSDSLALSRHAAGMGIDKDRLRLEMAQANLRAVGKKYEWNWIQADLNNPLPVTGTGSTSALFFDPARRSESRRFFHVDQYQPPLRIIWNWSKQFPHIGIKISPAVRLGEISEFDCEIEFISLHGELKEAVLWFGELRQGKSRATVLPQEVSMVATENEEKSSNKKVLSPPRQYLYEPDAAILRAGLVGKLADQLNAYQLDEDIAYLTSDDYTATPFVRVWRVEDWMPFNVKKLREFLRNRQVGKITVKIRGSPLDPQELQHQLKLKGENERILFLTHYASRPIVISAFVN